MSNVLQLIVNEQHALQEKKQSHLIKKIKHREQMRRIWTASGLPDIWNTVANIEVKNFAPHDVLGYYAPLSAFVNPLASCNFYGHGIELYQSKNNAEGYVAWEVDVIEHTKKPDEFVYRYRHTHLVTIFKTLDEFKTSFVTWLAKKIDPQTLNDLGFEPKEIKQAARRVIAVDGAV